MVLRFQPAMRLADPAMDELPGDQIAIGFNPAEAEKLFAGSGHTFKELVETAEHGDQLPRFPLAVSLEGRGKYTQQEVTSQNIVGILPGADPALKNEYVVISAHVDHLGVGEPINGDRIYNGAMDNASGVATLLDVADALQESHAKPRRSLLFLVLTGEEAGLLGSRYYTVHPTVPLAQIIGDLNIDMFLPIFPLKRLTVRGLEESDLGSLLKNVAATEGVEVQPDPAPERNAFIRSDQYSFIKKGIPSIFFSVGYTKGSPEEAAVKQWITNRYHAPSDDTHQPVDLAAAAKYNTIVLRLAEAMADGAKRPQWNPNSFFRRYAR
jgi:Zn-dependent M28 family amino/carboxypeptidase